MRIRIAATLLVSCAAFAWATVGHVRADLVTVDENGNGNVNGVPLPFTIGTDPGPGGLPGVLIYQLPFAGVQGDVLMADAGAVLDVVRFNGDGTLIFYSDNVDGFDSLADTFGPPGAFYPNRVLIDEVGPEGNNGAFYTPGPNDPGFDASGPSYNLISDSPLAVPEPASVSLLAFGIVGLVGYTWRRRKRCAP
jgi:hypothetical protein